MTARFAYSPSRYPPIPAVVLRLSAPGGATHVPDVLAHLATVQQLGLQPVGQVTAYGIGSSRHATSVYVLDVEIPNVGVVTADVVAHPDEDVMLIGRNILNGFRVTFDGPNLTVEFH